MGRWRGYWMCFKSSFIIPTKGVLLKANSRLRHKAKGNGYGLVGLYKDIESNGGYADIQVMWEMIHSSHPPNVHTIKRSKRASRRFCFMPS
ncbi:hypothetical protein AAG906_037095 [Vitis piasezkii]